MYPLPGKSYFDFFRTFAKANEGHPAASRAGYGAQK